MPEIKIEFSVWCNECGLGLCRQTTVKGDDVHVDPCPRCLEREGTAKYNEGYADREREGIAR